MLRKFQADTAEQLQVIAGQIAKVTNAGTNIFLEGPLGAGKTTFTRGFLRALGYNGKVKSPTFALVEAYEINNQFIFHFDLYRLEDANELEQIGIRDYFTPSSICLIEWPEKGFPLLPQPDLVCNIAFAGAGRILHLTAHTDQGHDILKKLAIN